MYIFRFPAGTTRLRVPRKEFYAISAAYGGLDLESEKAGPAPMVPVYVGGPEPGTLLLDLRRRLAPPGTPIRARGHARGAHPKAEDCLPPRCARPPSARRASGAR